ncbi:PD40 domain-containing protein [Polyangium aurulentum]|uniref:PD40 domain-containing protein n=1 Tax=Polyangium aurulentum TaxID=2567896 RepID=UPI0010AE1EA5|nr:PD40 domain-containing protein [Polyangium aurulentum]UQA61968.1 PD40 domain-containing protein [Polyangium aurulentum]
MTGGIAACGGGGSDTGGPTNGTGASGGVGQGGNNNGGGGEGGIFVGPGAGGGMMQGLDVQPSALQTLDIIAGGANPAVTYTATLDGTPIGAGWSVDRGDIGTIDAGPASTATFTPKGKAGGLVTITAGLNGQTVQRQVMVKLTGQQNGPDPNNPAEVPQIATTIPDLTAGGGIGGVGGEGLGVAVEDPGLIAALDSPSGDGAGEGFKYLYPYDKTVWPRGLLAPNLMWDWSLGDADAIKIELSTTSGSFSWKGTFGKPAILAQTGGKFIRHPIPQDVWAAATNSAGGATPDGSPDKLTVKLTVAKDGKAYGPIAETWTVAPARLSGIIYYNSYGTQLAKNYTGAIGGDGKFGGAVLSIRVGDTGPKLVAGSNGTSAQCRVCHSVAADGSRLVVQQGQNDAISSAYDLTPMGATEKTLVNGGSYPGVSPDGEIALTPAGKLVSLANEGTLLPVSGLSDVSTNIGTPAFSPDGKLAVFNPIVGPGVTNPKQKLVVMDFDAATGAFANPVITVDDTGQPAEMRPGWPAFYPDGKSVVFHQQTAAGVDGNNLGDLRTRKGAKAYLAWTSVNGSPNATPLDQLNGKDAAGNVYLPKLSQPISMSCTGDGAQVGNINADHSDDLNMNYEPTVNPIASGGYVWVVFTSRRMYGNVAAIPPFCSDPRGVDLVKNITPKKLWVAAVNLDAPPGTDASHPAFYLPGQELLAGNARGFWVLDPCKADGASCETGDQCCNGFCSPAGGDALVCSNMPPGGMCSKVQEKCTTAADCCDPTNVCINGFCSLKAPN